MQLRQSQTRKVKMDFPTRYAVLFKTHFWDSFVERQFRRLCERAAPGHVFIIVDETKIQVSEIRHDNVIRMTEATSEGEGYVRHPYGNLFWHNGDYPMFHFLDRHPEFDFVFICEYDCVVNVDIATIIHTMAQDRLGFVGERIRTPPEYWTWSRDARAYYPAGLDFVGRLSCCAAFSREFARQLQKTRLEHSRRALSGEIPRTDVGNLPWPIHEAVIGAEIARLGVAEASFSAFGDTSYYDWFPPYPEFALSALSGCAIVHPVLDDRRYPEALEKFHWKAQDLFDTSSMVRHLMGRCDPADVVRTFLHYFVQSGDFESIELLRQYADRRSGTAAPRLFNVARGKPATQSSTSPWSQRPDPALDAAGAVNGQVSGSFGFHTRDDEKPWWCLDLKVAHPVREIRIYNRMDQADRARSLVASSSLDLVGWNIIFKSASDESFGGVDGRPLKIELEPPVAMRFLRIHLEKNEFLHLDEVEIYV